MFFSKVRQLRTRSYASQPAVQVGTIPHRAQFDMETREKQGGKEREKGAGGEGG